MCFRARAEPAAYRYRRFTQIDTPARSVYCTTCRGADRLPDTESETDRVYLNRYVLVSDRMGWSGRYAGMRQTTNELLTPDRGNHIGRAIDWFITALILLNVVVLMVGTVDTLAAQYGRIFRWVEIFSVSVFTVEYVGRVWSAVEEDEYSGVISSRVRFASRPLLIVDLLAILPFYLFAFFGVSADGRFLRALRLLRLLRLLKLARYSESIQSFSLVLNKKKSDLLVTAFANLILLIITSSAMYYIEHQAQPETFSSIPQTLWWGVVTLTTVGYGDTFPVTPLGQLFGALVAVIGIGLFALPASILASGFLEVAHDETTECPHCEREVTSSPS